MQELEEQNKQLEMRIKMMEAQQKMMLESQERTNKLLESLQQGQRQNEYGGKGVELNSRQGRFPTQPSINPINIPTSHVHFSYDSDEDPEEIQAISRLRNGKELQVPYKGKGKEKMEEEEDRGEEEESSPCDEPLPSTYKPPIPYPSALKSSRSSTDHENRLLENIRKATMTVAVEDAIKCTPTLKKYLKESYTSRKPKEIVKLSECASSILNSTPKKREILELL